MFEWDFALGALSAFTGGMWQLSLQATALAVLCGFGLWAARVRSPAVRHAVWCLVAVVMLTMPWGDAWRSGSQIELPVGNTVYMVITAGAGATATPAAPAGNRPWLWFAGAVWLAGFLGLAARWALGAIWLNRVLATAKVIATPAGSNARWLESDKVRAPLAAGWVRPSVLLPLSWREWSAEKLAAVVAHESAHLRRRDPLFSAIVSFNRAAFWFHPLSWWLEKKAVAEAELACDDEASAALGDRRAYAQYLVEIAAGLGSRRERFAPGSAAMANAGPVTRRVERLLSGKPAGSGLLRGRQWATIAAIVLAVFAATTQVRPILAQAGGSGVSGAITDPSGASVPGAQVLLLDEVGDSVATTRSRNDGSFLVNPSGTGPYTLLVVADGFEPYRKSRLDVVNGASISQSIELQVQGIEEAIQIGPKVAQTGPGGQPTRIQVGGAVQKAKMLRVVRPSYPPDARAERVQGKVMLDAVINREGVPVELLAEANGVDSRLVEEAVAAVKQWRYKPTLLNGEAIEVQTKIQVNFTLAP